MSTPPPPSPDLLPLSPDALLEFSAERYSVQWDNQQDRLDRWLVHPEAQESLLRYLTQWVHHRVREETDAAFAVGKRSVVVELRLLDVGAKMVNPNSNLSAIDFAEAMARILIQSGHVVVDYVSKLEMVLIDDDASDGSEGPPGPTGD